MDATADAEPAATPGWMVAAAVLLTPPLAGWAAATPGLALGRPGPAALVVALVVAPLLEESVLRLLLQRHLHDALRRRGLAAVGATVAAGAGATIAFALIHLPAWSLAGLLDCAPWLLPGAALAATWGWRRRLRDCVLMHAFFNASLWLAGLRAG